MKRIYGLLLAALCLPLWLAAENYPYRSDLLWVTCPDHADWIYRTGERASIEVQLYRYGIPVQDQQVCYEVGDDLGAADTSGSIVLRNGRATIPVGTMKKPGFRDCRLTTTIDGKQYRHHIKIGFSPEKIEPHTAMPADFEAFWERQKARLAEFPLQYTKERAEKYCTDKIDCFLIKLPLDKRGHAVYGYLFIPRGAEPGSCPAVLTPPGAGVKTIREPMRHKYYTEQGCIRFVFEIHGLNPELPEETFREISTAFGQRENGYLCNGLDDPESFYMKRVYLACVRGIDLLASLPEWDGKNIIAQGGSQGGALAIVAAGLDSRVTACVANHPALSDMARFEAGSADGYPHYSRLRGMDTPEKIRTMAYYDAVNFARLIEVPTRITWGYNDDTCPPTTSYALFNTLRCEKEALVTPINEHWTSAETEYGHLKWILRHLLE